MAHIQPIVKSSRRVGIASDTTNGTKGKDNLACLGETMVAEWLVRLGLASLSPHQKFHSGDRRPASSMDFGHFDEMRYVEGWKRHGEFIGGHVHPYL